MRRLALAQAPGADEAGQTAVPAVVALGLQLNQQGPAVRRSSRGLCASAFNAYVSVATNGASLPGDASRRYFDAASAGALSRFLIVLRDRLVRLAISLIDFPSRWCSTRSLPLRAMVITVQIPCHKLQQSRCSPWSVFSRHYAGLMVNIRSAPTDKPAL